MGKTSNTFNDHINKQKIICEWDRNRMTEFFTNKWINQLTSHKDGINNKNYFMKENLKNLTELSDIQDVFKDIRYCFYKYYDGNTLLKYSKDAPINKIFKKAYPHLSPEQILSITKHEFEEEIGRRKINKELNVQKNKSAKVTEEEVAQALIAKVEVLDQAQQKTEGIDDDTRLMDFCMNPFNQIKTFGSLIPKHTNHELKYNGRLKKVFRFLCSISDLCRLTFVEIAEGGLFFRRPYQNYESIF